MRRINSVRKRAMTVVMSISMLTIFTTSHAVEVAAPLPKMDNVAYILIDSQTGQILAQKNANKPLPPASLTKMMTSYIVEQHLLSGKLKENDPIWMSENAWCRGSNRQSCMFAPVNESGTAIDMLRGIIIQSGNDAAIAVAEHLSGNESAFARLMNEEAKKLGMKQTHFVNATGLSATNHYSSANDLAKLAQAIIKNSGQYYKIYAEKSFTYNGITQQNRNSLLRSDPTVDGLKTGYTQVAGYCLVSTSKRDDKRLISVILGAKSAQARAEQSRTLLEWGYNHINTKLKPTAVIPDTQAPMNDAVVNEQY